MNCGGAASLPEPAIGAIESVAQRTLEPAVEGTFEPNVGGAFEPVADATFEPAVEGTLEPDVERTFEPAADDTFEPAADDTSEPAADDTFEPAAAGALKPVVAGRPESAAAEKLEAIAAEARACTVCTGHLPLGPRPVFRVSATARLLIVGQAPGTKVHETGIPWNDPSGERLRGWLAMDRDLFYDHTRIAILPMGLCYPGRLPNGGDAPPRPECAPLWQVRLLSAMPAIRLTLLVGSYALSHVLGKGAMTGRVRGFREHLPRYFPLPHPSWRTTAWERKNPWFQAEVLPLLRESVAGALS